MKYYLTTLSSCYEKVTIDQYILLYYSTQLKLTNKELELNTATCSAEDIP